MNNFTKFEYQRSKNLPLVVLPKKIDPEMPVRVHLIDPMPSLLTEIESILQNQKKGNECTLELANAHKIIIELEEELEMMTEKYTQLEEEMFQLQAKRKYDLETKENMKKQIADLKNALQRCNYEWRSKYEYEMDMLINVSAQKEKKNEEIVKMYEKCLQNKEEQIKSIENDFQRQKEKARIRQEQYDGIIQNSQKNLIMQRENSESQIAKLKANIFEIENYNRQYMEQKDKRIEECIEEIYHLKSAHSLEVLSLKGENRNLRTLLTENEQISKRKYENYEKTKNNLILELSKAHEKIQENEQMWKSSFESVFEQKQKLFMSLSTKNAENSQMAMRIQGLKESYQRINQRLEETESENSNLIIKYEMKISEMNDQIENKESLIINLSRKIDDLSSSSQIKHMEEKVIHHLKEIEKLGEEKKEIQSSLNQEIETLKSGEIELSKQIEKIKFDYTLLKKKQFESNSQLQKLRKENEESSQKISDFQQELDQSKKKYKESLKSSEKKVKRREEEVEKISKEKQERENQNHQLLNAIKEKEETINLMSQEKVKMSKDMTCLENESQRKQKRISGQQIQLNEKDQKIQKLEEKIFEVNRSFIEKLKQKDEKIIIVEKKMNKMEKQRNEEKKYYEDEFEKNKKTVNEIQGQNENLKKQLKQSQKSKDQYNLFLEKDFHQRLEKVKRENVERVRELEEKIRAHQSVNQSLELKMTQFIRMEQELLSIKDQMEEMEENWRRQLKQAEERSQMLKEKLRREEDEKEKFVNENIQFVQRIKSLEKNLKASEQKVQQGIRSNEKMRKSIQTLEESMSNFNVKLIDFETQVCEKSERIGLLQDLLETCQKSLKQVQVQLMEKKRELESCNESIAYLEQANKSEKMEKQSLKGEIQSLKNEIKKQTSTISTLQIKIKGLDSDNNSLKFENKQLQWRSSSKEKEIQIWKLTVEENRKKIEELKSSKFELIEKVENIETSKNKLQRKLAYKSEEMMKMRESYENKMDEIKARSEQNANLYIQDFKTVHERNMREKSEELKNAFGEINCLKSKIKSMDQEIQENIERNSQKSRIQIRARDAIIQGKDEQIAKKVIEIQSMRENTEFLAGEVEYYKKNFLTLVDNVKNCKTEKTPDEKSNKKVKNQTDFKKIHKVIETRKKSTFSQKPEQKDENPPPASAPQRKQFESLEYCYTVSPINRHMTPIMDDNVVNSEELKQESFLKDKKRDESIFDQQSEKKI